ncbi:cupin domain-containing protein [Anoxybacterium hadale]|uniref:Cupin domain-containing protein n=1 Tax=Anoxybacterium hadale TaxID=3408580 RepID=A0ACD1A705_9FIRM|nr:cupin domain-containing protein [Clostridiales bacterium]
MAKAYVKNYYDLTPAAPARHLNAHAFAFGLPATMDSDTYNFFSICEIRFGGAAILDNHKDADHCYFILSGKGYSIIKGKRYEYKVGDVMWIPGNSDHEMYPIGVQTLKFLVTLTPKEFNQTEPFIRNINDVTPVPAADAEKATAFPISNPKNGGSKTIEFQVVEILPDGVVSGQVAESDQMSYVISGKGYVIADGEKLPLSVEDGFYIPKGVKYEIHPDGCQALRIAQSFGPARLASRD